MPQEPQNTNRNKHQRPAAGKRRSRLDSFRWDFVPEDLPNPAADFVPPTKKKKLKLDDHYGRPLKKKTAEKRPQPEENPATAAAGIRLPAESSGQPASPSAAASASASPKPRSSRKRSRRKAVLPPVSPILVDEDDEELRLPSYGRTPVPDDDELLPPSKPLRTKLPQPKQPLSKLPELKQPQPKQPLPKQPLPKPAKQKPAQTERIAESQESRPPGLQHREQMVWDPDKLQYVPLTIPASQPKKEKRAAGERSSRERTSGERANGERASDGDANRKNYAKVHGKNHGKDRVKDIEKDGEKDGEKDSVNNIAENTAKRSTAPPKEPRPSQHLSQHSSQHTQPPPRRKHSAPKPPQESESVWQESGRQDLTRQELMQQESARHEATRTERHASAAHISAVHTSAAHVAAAHAAAAKTPFVQTSFVKPKSAPPVHRGETARFIESARPDPADIENAVAAESGSGFAELGVSETMLEALKVVRYLEPTPIQSGVFKKVKEGVDLMGQAQTGTGKTAAFSIPIIEGIEECPPGNDPVALILVPTRELAVQVRDEAERLAYGREVRITACYGGKPLGKQIARLREGIDLVVGTPGRVLDLMNRGALSLNLLRWVVLDEADRMLDIGFRPQIEKILRRTPQNRQTLLFSATLPQPVVRLAERYMNAPEVLDFSNKSVAVDTIDQYYVTVDPERKFDALVHLLKEQEPKQAIIFTRTKRGADRLARLLAKHFVNLAAIHGDLTQSDRDRVMAQVRAGSLRYLVATDVVGRGIDVSGISHIINYDIPQFCDDYVHRVGRTGRMGREGVAFTFVTAEQGSELTRIEMRIDKLLKRAELQGFEAFTKPHDPNASLDDTELPDPPKPVFGKPVRKVRKAL